MGDHLVQVGCFHVHVWTKIDQCTPLQLHTPYNTGRNRITLSVALVFAFA